MRNLAAADPAVEGADRNANHAGGVGVAEHLHRGPPSRASWALSALKL
jgi:hypothetical protein